MTARSSLRLVALGLVALLFAPTLAAALPLPLLFPLSGRTVVVDAGHGGGDPGARDYYEQNGLRCPHLDCPDEKELNLRVARELAVLLRARGAVVIETRTDDSTVSLAERVRVANEAGADAFVSVHHNSCCGGRGTETFYFGDGVTYSAEGRRLATDLQDRVVGALGTFDRGVRADKAWLGFHLYVLRYTRPTAALSEISFLSNQADYDQAQSPVAQATAARALADGVGSYFG